MIVVAHDSGDDLLQCARSVLAQAGPDPAAALPAVDSPLVQSTLVEPPLAESPRVESPRVESPLLELIVVDNASRDGAIAALPADPRVRVVLNPHNRGFAQACNQGAEIARADYLLFLNPDCVLPPGALATLLQVCAADARLGVLGAQLLDADGTLQRASHREDPAPLRAVLQALGLRGAGQHRHAPAGGTEPPRDAAVRVDVVSGALMLLPRRAFRQLDGFDPGYVLHCEDLDLCRRARQAGFGVAFAPAVRVLHRKGTSSARRPLWVEWQKHRGMWRYFQRFDARDIPMLLQPLLWFGLWGHFVLAAARAWLRARRHGAQA